MKKRGIAYKLPLCIFAFCVTVLITFQTTYMYVTRRWQTRVSEMIQTDKTVISEKLSELDQNVKSASVYSQNTTELVENTVYGYLSGLGDNYAMYLNEDQYRDYVSNVSGNVQNTSVGIGISALYDIRADGIYVVNVYPDSPASSAGILPGEVITHVNDIKVSHKGFYGAMSLIASGRTQSKVALTVKSQDGTSRELEVDRDVVNVKSISSRVYEGKVGIIRISEFNSGCADDFKTEAQKLITSGVERFIIDIRNNPGGAPEDIALLLDFLLPDGVTITGKDRDGNLKQHKSDPNEFTYPITLVVNKNTVCGAELFAAALRDFKNVSLVGEATYGKATYQQMYTMPDGSAVSLSSVMYTTPKGALFDKTGLLPDKEVSQEKEAYEKYNNLDDADDVQLTSAAEVVSQMEYSGPDNS